MILSIDNFLKEKLTCLQWDYRKSNAFSSRRHPLLFQLRNMLLSLKVLWLMLSLSEMTRNLSWTRIETSNSWIRNSCCYKSLIVFKPFKLTPKKNFGFRFASVSASFWIDPSTWGSNHFSNFLPLPNCKLTIMHTTKRLWKKRITFNPNHRN